MSNNRTFRIKVDMIVTFDDDLKGLPSGADLLDGFADTAAAVVGIDGYMHPGAKVSVGHAKPPKSNGSSLEGKHVG